MTRSLLVNFHLYTPFGKEFYNPILDFFLNSMKKYEDEYDHLYLLDSNWEIEPEKIKDMKASIIRTNPSMRYYDCFKEVLPQVKEDLVLLMDNDMVVYRLNQMDKAFNIVGYGVSDIVSIYDTIGTYKTDKLRGKNKFCPYWFCTKKKTLMKYLDVDWSPDMPYCETLGHLTEAMLNDDLRPYEWDEDKSEATFENGEVKTEKNLGYYHIRAGSEPAILLAWKNSPEHLQTYKDYIKNQPKQEIIRHCSWYKFMGGNPDEILKDL